MSLRERIKIPNYTLGEERMNAISHGIGGLLGIAALVLCVVKSCIQHNNIAVVASSIYGATLIFLYFMSTLYHSLKVNNAKRVFNIIDHCSIFLLIAGSYTPYTLITLKGALGWGIFGVIWLAAIIGIVFNAIDLNKYKKISVLTYILMGWMIIFAFKPLYESLSKNGLVLLVWGGVLYTVGAIFYGLGKKKKYMHSIFHLFVLAGSILQFFSIYYYVI